MRGRPDVDIKLPPVVRPGDDIDVEMTFESGSDTPIDFIDASLVGDEILSLAIDGDQRLLSRSIVHQTERLRERGTLTEGAHRLRARFKVPGDAPASYLGVRITIRYEVRLHVSIPWWPDLKETYEVLVEPHAAQRPKPRPMTAMNAASPGEPFIEVSLTDTAFAAGDEVSGAFSVGNLAHRHNEGIEISLVAIEHARANGGVRGGEQFRFIVPTVFQAPRSGGVVPFRFRVPKDVVPSFRTPWCELTWAVHALLRTSWTWNTAPCIVLVTIGRHNLPREGGGAQPDIGVARWRRVWSEAGDKHGLSLSGSGLELEGSRGDVQISITHQEGDDGEPALVATLRYPSLELGLQVAPQFLVVLPNDLEVLLSGHKATCRELAQGCAFFDAELRAALAPFKAVRAGDKRAIVRAPGAGHGQPGLDDFLARAVALAEALSAAIERVPPPTTMQGALPAWRAFAAATGAHLSPGGMVLSTASVDGAVFDVVTLFSEEGAANGTCVGLELDPPLTYRADVSDPASFAAAPPGSLDLAVALRASVRALDITQHALSIELEGPTLDPENLRPKMVEMLVLARRLRGDRSPGPYR